MVKKYGKIPCNARVDVVYTKGKPKVKFGYTSKNPIKDAESQSMYGYSFLFIMALCLIPIYLYDAPIFYEGYPESCNVTLNDYHSNQTSFVLRNISGNLSNYTIKSTYNVVYGANFTCNNHNYSLEFPVHQGFDEKYLKDILPSRIYNARLQLLVLIFIPLSFLVNFLVTKWLVRQNFYQRWLPKHMAGSMKKRKKYYKYTSKDMDENVLVIPSFKNIELIYNTEGDFSKYLRRIKIREERYNKYKNEKKGKLVVDNFKWYAVFFFSKKPANGFLEVIWQ